MDSEKAPIQALEEIKQMMDRGSRFVSLSGLSGVAAGVCALVAAGIAYKKLYSNRFNTIGNYRGEDPLSISELMQAKQQLFLLALITFFAAFLLAFLFTLLRSKKTGVPVWGFIARKVLVNIVIPMLMGGLVVWRLADYGYFGFIAPSCLIFYGLALVNASKFTLSEVRYLGYFQLLLGAINLWAIGYGLFFWAAGFGVLHIIYGIMMWLKYERKEKTVAS